MGGIAATKTAIINFFQEEFDVSQEAIQVIGLIKKGEQWQGKVVVTETNQYLKLLGYPPVFDKNEYTITLDMDLNVTSYVLGERDEEED